MQDTDNFECAEIEKSHKRVWPDKGVFEKKAWYRSGLTVSHALIDVDIKAIGFAFLR